MMESFEWDEAKNDANQEKHGVSFESAQDTGEKEKRHMKKKIKYTGEDMGEIEIVKDFLPSPEELVLKEKNVRVTLNLKQSSIAYFKKVANKNHTQYQKIIRNLLDYYVSQVPTSGKKKAA